MKSHDVKEIVKTALSLFLICAVAAGILAGVNFVTAPTIEKNNAEKADLSRAEVLSAADSFEALDIPGAAAFRGTAKGDTVGYVFTCAASGYNGAVEVMTGIDSDGKITGIKILTINETPGLGMNANKPAFLQQYEGKSSALKVVKGAAGDDSEIAAITSATITSTAVTNAVNEALSLFSQIKEVQ